MPKEIAHTINVVPGVSFQNNEAYGNGGGLKNTTVANNTFYKSSTAVLWIESDAHANSVVENNIFDQAGGGDVVAGVADVAGAAAGQRDGAFVGFGEGHHAVGDAAGLVLVQNFHRVSQSCARC